MPSDPISERMIDVADDAFRSGSSDEQAWRECLGDALYAVYPLIREQVMAEASQGKRAVSALLPVNEPGCRAPHCWNEYGTPCATCPAATPDQTDDEGWSPGIDDPKPPALGDIDTGEGWYQT